MLVSVVGQGAVINGDRTRVREAVQNLIVNAAKHKRTGEPVTVRLESTGLDTAIRIGVGVGGSAKSAVIERYAVGEEDGTSSGIGLSLAQAVAGRHSGKLNVRWDDEGSEAELIIPVFKLKKSV